MANSLWFIACLSLVWGTIYLIGYTEEKEGLNSAMWRAHQVEQHRGDR